MYVSSGIEIRIKKKKKKNEQVVMRVSASVVRWCERLPYFHPQVYGGGDIRNYKQLPSLTLQPGEFPVSEEPCGSANRDRLITLMLHVDRNSSSVSNFISLMSGDGSDLGHHRVEIVALRLRPFGMSGGLPCAPIIHMGARVTRHFGQWLRRFEHALGLHGDQLPNPSR